MKLFATARWVQFVTIWSNSDKKWNKIDCFFVFCFFNSFVILIIVQNLKGYEILSFSFTWHEFSCLEWVFDNARNKWDNYSCTESVLFRPIILNDDLQQRRSSSSSSVWHCIWINDAIDHNFVCHCHYCNVFQCFTCMSSCFPQFKQQMLDTLYKYAKFQYECGNYSGTAEYLYFVRVLVSWRRIEWQFWIERVWCYTCFMYNAWSWSMYLFIYIVLVAWDVCCKSVYSSVYSGVLWAQKSTSWWEHRATKGSPLLSLK